MIKHLTRFIELRRHEWRWRCSLHPMRCRKTEIGYSRRNGSWSRALWSTCGTGTRIETKRRIILLIIRRTYLCSIGDIIKPINFRSCSEAVQASWSSSRRRQTIEGVNTRDFVLVIRGLALGPPFLTHVGGRTSLRCGRFRLEIFIAPSAVLLPSELLVSARCRFYDKGKEMKYQRMHGMGQRVKTNLNMKKCSHCSHILCNQPSIMSQSLDLL